MTNESTVIIGAGPAGLAAAWECARQGRSCAVVDSDACVGGICRTVERGGYRFDIGGHRFFTKNAEVMALWREVLGEELLERPRLSRIYFRKRFFHYPIRPFNALAGLGPVETARIILDYLRARIRPIRPETTFDEWVTNRFGRRLYEVFFKTYTEKVWGIPCERISAGWVAQRIRGLSLVAAVMNALFGDRGKTVRTLIDRFHYPRLGPGQLYDAMARTLEDGGRPILRGHAVRSVCWEETPDGPRVRSVVCATAGGDREMPADQVISSMPLDGLVRALDPPAPADVLAAARSLRYRSIVVVNLVIDRPMLFPDTWIYVHDPAVHVGRIQNPRAWSPAMVPDPARASLGMEYFATEGDELWRMADGDLVALAARELAVLGLVDRPDRVADGFVVRAPRTYCVHDDGYEPHVATIRAFLDRFANLQPVGRYGMFKYNNMDHSILTGLLAARNLAGGRRNDIWAVNTEQEYHEEKAIREGVYDHEAHFPRRIDAQ